jgi:hypothetical protein
MKFDLYADRLLIGLGVSAALTIYALRSKKVDPSGSSFEIPFRLFVLPAVTAI